MSNAAAIATMETELAYLTANVKTMRRCVNCNSVAPPRWIWGALLWMPTTTFAPTSCAPTTWSSNWIASATDLVLPHRHRRRTVW